MSKSEETLLFKILTLGDTKVGKTSFILRYTDNIFHENPLSTIGVDFQRKTVIHENKKLEIQIWDSAGQEKFHSISRQYYNKANGVLLVYDITNKESYDSIKVWIKEIKQNTQVLPIMLLIGNKNDLQGKLDEKDGMDLAEKYGLHFFSTSAKTGNGIDKAMEMLVKLVYEDYVKNYRGRVGGGSQLAKNTSNKKKCC